MIDQEKKKVELYLNEKWDGWMKDPLNKDTFFEILQSKMSVEQAIKKIDLLLMFKKPAKKKIYKDTLEDWWIEKDTGVGVFQETIDVGIAQHSTASKGDKKHILFTTSIAGCIGISIWDGKKGFLMHIDPGQLDEYSRKNTFATIARSLPKGMVTLSSPAGKSSYYNILIEWIHSQKTYKVLSFNESDRLALDVNTGGTKFNFKNP